MKMHNARYLSLRKQNVLSLMNLYIIFILFISNLNSFYCAMVSNDDLGGGGGATKNNDFCYTNIDGQCEDVNNGNNNNLDNEILPNKKKSVNIETINIIYIKSIESTITKKDNVVNEDENEVEENIENESESENKYDDIDLEKENKTETLNENIRNENIINTYDNKTEIEYKSLSTEYESKTEEYYIEEESFNNSENIYNNIKSDLIQNFNKTENNYIKIPTNNNYSFQITTVNNQMDSLLNNIKSEFSVIDLKDCTKKLNKEIGRDEDADLIILKYENENQVNGNKKSIQYEIYEPETNKKLDLTI